MDQNQNVKPTNNQVVVKPKKPVLLRIITMTLLLVSGIIFLWSTLVLFNYDSQTFLGSLLLWIAGTGFIMGLAGIIIAFGLSNMKKWALYIYFLLTIIFFGLTILSIAVYSWTLLHYNPSTGPVGGEPLLSIFCFVVTAIFVLTSSYLWSIRKQFN